jgi:ssDNA-binding Zn-finger/Zn-ribbon topoisomerase 1
MSALPTGEPCVECKEGYLVERTNSKTGHTFLGCSEWPDCDYTKHGGSNAAPLKAITYCEADYYDDMDEDGYYGGDWGDGEF